MIKANRIHCGTFQGCGALGPRELECDNLLSGNIFIGWEKGVRDRDLRPESRPIYEPFRLISVTV